VNDYGHWTFHKDFDPNEWFGFVYRIIENDTGRQYIGKKQFESIRRVKKKNRKNRVVKRKESNWKTYTGSSKHLNKSIEEKGIENYTFNIISLHETKGSLYYKEVKLQIEEDVMLSDEYYNAQIGAVKFKVPKQTLKEAKYNL